MRDLLGPQKTCISLFRPYRSNQLPRLILFLSKIIYVYIRLYYPLPCCCFVHFSDVFAIFPSYNNPFPIDLAPIGIQIGAESIGNCISNFETSKFRVEIACL